MKNLVILISGRGSNMEAIVRACAQEAWGARIAAVIANRPDAAGLAFAASNGIATAVVDHRQFPDRASFDAALAQVIDGYAPDLVVLAGFMRVLTESFVGHYAGRMLNIHPSLLPMFPGLGTHQQALDAGCRVHGATVHFVTPTLDHGPIVAQAVVPVRAGDDAAALAARVLKTEHVMYPRAVRWFVEGRLALDGECVTLTPAEPQWLFFDDSQAAGEGA
ncbi:phosphoribosylglycinamide formyltransferase [Paraburkholderia sp. CNPSo 3076]|uniref:phosphoribosylglycinamide formyltransferase n=1 Tax=Paraburkholderia sp. CNPSo 3076 TaxID=2940936 RepID=UPI00225B365B|nr:phosphoribosylglycinamide formyltransferase [Paraburkholderia sp. CNPSo 3076]MCX5542314.1 phosphoribosylglycinamide formyltransferase [Paraburkholderia sp. CNPSo 3076]